MARPSLNEALDGVYVTVVYENGNKETLGIEDLTYQCEDFNKDNPGTYEVVINVLNEEVKINIEVLGNSYYLPNSLETLNSYADKNGLSYGLPSTGNSKALVIPVEFIDYKAPANMKTNLEKAFFGTSEDTGWESLTSYYNKASYGKLNIEGTVLDVYNTNKTSTYYNRKYIAGEDADYLIIKDVLEYYDNQINYDEYDSNNDGYIDAVYMVYNCPIGGDGSDTDYDFYWAYTYWDFYADDRTYQETKGYAYVFTAYDFFEEQLPHSKEYLPINCETIIHETGHLLNLDDYYDYDTDDTYNNDGGYCVSDMMDSNFGDHGPFSKILLDWIDPVVISKDGIYELPSFQASGICFVIGENKNFNSIFSEYYIIDFYTFGGLNALQNKAYYNTTKDYAGIRVSLANAQLTYEDEYYPIFTYNNTDARYKVLQMLEADYDGRFDLSTANTDSTLNDFYQKNDTFGDGYYETFKSSKNNKVPFIMEVLDINNEYATIKITFK